MLFLLLLLRLFCLPWSGGELLTRLLVRLIIVIGDGLRIVVGELAMRDPIFVRNSLGQKVSYLSEWTFKRGLKARRKRPSLLKRLERNFVIFDP